MPEQLVLTFSTSRWEWVRYYTMAVMLIVAAIAIEVMRIPFGPLTPYKFHITVALVGIGTVLIAIAEILQRRDVYILTNSRIIERIGLFARRELWINWDKVAQIVRHQSLRDRLLGIGRLEIKTVGGAEAPEIFTKRIAHIQYIEQLIGRLMRPSPTPPAPRG